MAATDSTLSLSLSTSSCPGRYHRQALPPVDAGKIGRQTAIPTRRKPDRDVVQLRAFAAIAAAGPAFVIALQPHPPLGPIVLRPGRESQPSSRRHNRQPGNRRFGSWPCQHRTCCLVASYHATRLPDRHTAKFLSSGTDLAQHSLSRGSGRDDSGQLRHTFQ